MKIFGFEITNKNTPVAQEQSSRIEKPSRQKRLSDSVNRPQPYQITMQMSTLREAVEMARDTMSPSWINLHEIYRNAMTDAQVRSQYETAVNKLQASPFMIATDGTDNEQKTELLRRPWFSEYLRILFDAELWGYTLAEFGKRDADGEFEDVDIFPRSNVYPFNKNIILNDTDTQGFYYGDKPEAFYLIEIGGKRNIGLLELISREVIWKAFARRDWSELGEKWGMPRLIMKTDSEGAELTARQTGLANFGHNGYMITGMDDEIEKMESSSNGNGYLVFSKHIELANEEIAKLINGQTGSSEEMAYVGAAEVHERILNDFHSARLRRYTNHINYELIPFLQYHGYPLTDKDRIRFTELDPKTFDENKDNTNPQDPNNPDNQDNPTHQEPQNLLKKKAVAATDPLEEWLKRFYNGADGIDPEIWNLNFTSLVNAMRKAGVEFTTNYQYAALAKELKTNAAVFAAFKNHDEQQVLRDLLVDANGEPVSLGNFLKEAMPVTEKYNKDWLKTEFKQAQASAQMAVKWEGFSENADLYPNLEYRAVMDNETRDEHRLLNGTIKPINDPFWNTYYPPNGWGCRCTVTQTDKDIFEPAKIKGIEPDKGFDFNPGKDRKLFSDEASYMGTVDDKQRKTITKEAQKLLKEGK